MNILLVCASGMSTSLLMTKMQQESENRGMVNHIFACSVDELEQYIEQFDVVLIGPQIRYKEASIGALAREKNKAYAVIDALNYGMVNGQKVLDQALDVK
jgi:cellobiose PTS system EIIB component